MPTLQPSASSQNGARLRAVDLHAGTGTARAGFRHRRDIGIGVTPHEKVAAEQQGAALARGASTRVGDAFEVRDMGKAENAADDLAAREAERILPRSRPAAAAIAASRRAVSRKASA